MTEKYGFVYIWFDKKRKMYYIGSHWGTENDGYICSSNWMRTTYKRRPSDFKRRILSRIYTNRQELLDEEQRWLDMINPKSVVKENTTKGKRDENVRYYNLNLNSFNNTWWANEDSRLTVGEKISKAKKGKSTGPCPEETKTKIGNANRGRKFTKEHKEKLRQAKLGTKRSEAAKRKTSETLRQTWKDPDKFVGRKQAS